MRKITVLIITAVLLWQCAGLWVDMNDLHENVIRLHVVGASNEKADQDLKLQVKDAVNQRLAQLLENADSADEARAVLLLHLDDLEETARQVLESSGINQTVRVSLEEEPFPIRQYETFTLPSGVYHSLRISIGPAEGRNWWCVVFPTLCSAETGTELEDTAAGAGFSDTLTQTLTGEDGYEIRFFILDLFGQIQNFFAGK